MNRTYCFIDAQNLYLGIKQQGWEIDYKKLYVYLRDKYKVDEVFLFIGYIPENEDLYANLASCGYCLIFKDTTNISNGNKQWHKGNVDVDLTVHAFRMLNKYEKCLFVSGDGDFDILYSFLIDECDKELLIFIPNRKAYSNKLGKYRDKLRYMDDLKNKIGK